MSSTPTLFASNPLTQFTMLSKTRVAASASTTSKSAVTSEWAFGVISPRARIPSTRYC